MKMMSSDSATNLRTLIDFNESFETQLKEFENKIAGDSVGKGIKAILAKTRWIRPNFSKCWIIPKPPASASLGITYDVNGTRVKIYELPGGVESLYHIEPLEYNLSKVQLQLIEHALKELVNHVPEGLNIRNPGSIIEYIKAQSGQFLIQKIQDLGISLGKTRFEEHGAIDTLIKIIIKYTVGFGPIEVLLEDKNVQDIYIDAPVDENRVYISLGSINGSRLSPKCITNIILSRGSAEGLMSRFRYESGRPFSEAHPLLECDNDMFSTRVTVIGEPVSPKGLAFALRRHSKDPWTLPKLISVKSLNPDAAGLISFLIDGQSTMLIAGGRGSGKSSLLGAVMFEFAPSQRILTIEDTLELPGAVMQELGYKVQTIHIQSSVRGLGSMTADEALRISLRLGESAIVLGEVRGAEAKTLYEAMRAGTAGSAVLGTFHADSASAVYERVVYDMGISKEAFGSTDIVIVAGLIRPSGTHRFQRRVLQIAELDKTAESPGTFNDLFTYKPEEDKLIETDFFKTNSTRLRSIGRSWGMTYADVLENIKIRSELKKLMVDRAHSKSKPELMSGRWVYKANSKFWELLQNQYPKNIKVDYETLRSDWKIWFLKESNYD